MRREEELFAATAASLEMLGDRAWLFLANLTLSRSTAWAAMLDRADRVTDPPYEFIIIPTTGSST